MIYLYKKKPFYLLKLRILILTARITIELSQILFFRSRTSVYLQFTFNQHTKLSAMHFVML